MDQNKIDQYLIILKAEIYKIPEEVIKKKLEDGKKKGYTRIEILNISINKLMYGKTEGFFRDIFKKWVNVPYIINDTIENDLLNEYQHLGIKQVMVRNQNVDQYVAIDFRLA